VKELVEYMAKALVEHPEQVVVKEFAGEKSLTYELRVGPGDLGKIIGREGRTAKSLRAIVAAAAMRLGKHAHLEILE
jgi:predicted RNA-binding protein YlqC (UPF0109 family)